ncbi:unnamed protein product, partial [Nesidiocoris tenuis]
MDLSKNLPDLIVNPACARCQKVGQARVGVKRYESGLSTTPKTTVLPALPVINSPGERYDIHIAFFISHQHHRRKGGSTDGVCVKHG